MHTKELAELFIDWMGLPSLLLLAGIFIYRKWFRAFPLFFIYVLGAELVGIVRLLFRSAPIKVYAHIYWVSDTALAAFAFLATYELFFKRVFPGFQKTRFYRYLFPIAAILITSLVAAMALIAGTTRMLPVTTRVYELLRAVTLFFFAALTLAMGRRWDKQEFGIALGFALDVSTSLALIGIWYQTTSPNEILVRLSVIAYDIACIIWICCFWPAPKVQPTAGLAPEALSKAKEWEGSLKRFIDPGKK